MSEDVKKALEGLVRSLVVEVADIDEGSVDSETFLFPELAGDIAFDYEAAGLKLGPAVSLDSLDLLDIVIGIEGVFGIRIDLETAFEEGQLSPADLASIERIAAFLQRILTREQVQAWQEQSDIRLVADGSSAPRSGA